MAFRFRKSIKIAPGLRVNLTKNGISSASVGCRGATVNIGKKGLTGTLSIPGSGLSYSQYSKYDHLRVVNSDEPAVQKPALKWFKRSMAVAVVGIAMVITLIDSPALMLLGMFLMVAGSIAMLINAIRKA